MNNFLSLIGFLLPPLIDVVNNKISNGSARFWVSVLICGLVGTLIEFVLTGGLTFEGVSTQILLTFGMAQLTYNGLWKGSTPDKTLKELQS
jgi:hypothetical protein